MVFTSKHRAMQNMFTNGYVPLKYNDNIYDNYYINQHGQVMRLRLRNNKKLDKVYYFKEVSQSTTINGTLKFNVTVMKTSLCMQTHLAVWESFGKEVPTYGNVMFINGDKTCSDFNNLISGEELLEFYNKFKNTIDK